MSNSFTLDLFPEEARNELAQNRASSSNDRDDSGRTEFAYLEEAARKKAKDVVRTGRLHQGAWDTLVPILDKMQKLLSQRGADHAQAEPGLPEWRVWWVDFSTKNYLNISFRTVQDRLRTFRKEPRDKNSQRPLATRTEQRQLTGTAKLAHRLAVAVQDGKGIREALDTFLRDSLPLERVDEIENRLTSNSDQFDPMDKTALAKAMIRMAGPQIRACLEGLGPEETRDVLQTAFSRIISKFCSDGEIRVSVDCFSRSVSPSKANLITMSIDHQAA